VIWDVNDDDPPQCDDAAEGRIIGERTLKHLIEVTQQLNNGDSK